MVARLVLRIAALVACWTQCAAWQAAMKPIAARSPKISMVQWSNVPGDVGWAQVAWVNLGLTAADLGSECIFIPEELCVDPSANVRSIRG